VISKADVVTVIDEAEGGFRECWDTLFRLKGMSRGESSKDAALSKALLDFQPTLARALYDLSEMYRKLHQQKLQVIARKAELTSEWFGHRLALIGRYQLAIKAAISVGKRIGDSFAWVFFVSAQDHLLEHGEHQRQFHTPPGIGGLGEVAFVERAQVVGGHLVLYHGITTFLRVGDVSYINVKERKVAAIGELKTTKVAEGKLVIRVDVVASSEEDLSFLAGATLHHSIHDTEEKNPLPPLPQEMTARLGKQVASMGDTFEFAGPEASMELHHDPRIEELSEFCKELKTSTFSHRKIGDGLLLFGTRTAKRSLSSKLLGGAPPGWTSKLQGTERGAQRIMNKDSANNELWIGAFSDTNTEYRLVPGRAPILFWPLDAATIEDILFHKAEIYHLYNPAHLLAKSRRAGFEVMPIPGQRGFKVEKRIGDTIFSVENLRYYTHLVTREFWDEDVVVEALCGAARSVEQGDISPNARIRMDFRQ
jgi:hypothetical protein